MINQLLEEVKSMITSMANKNKTIKALTEENETLKIELQEANSKIANLNSKVDDLTSESEKVKKELEDYKSQENLNLEQLQVAINELKSLIDE